MSSNPHKLRNLGSEVTSAWYVDAREPSTSCKRYQTPMMGRYFLGLFAFTTWLSLTWSFVEANVPTCQSLTNACRFHGLDCQQRLPGSLNGIQSHCQALLNDPEQPCSSECEEALQSLAELPVSGWFTCDCTGMMFFSTGESQCMEMQNNLVNCSNYPTPVASTANSIAVARTPGHLPSHTTRPPTSTCSDAKTVCDGVASCRAALGNVLSVCEVSASTIEADDDDVCSMMCVKAMSKLEEQQTEALQLWGCDCLDESGTVRGDTSMSLPWCYIFGDSFLEKCVATEERHVTYGPISSPKDSNRADPQVGDEDPVGNGIPSPRLSSPSRWVYFVTISVVAIILNTNQRNM